MNRTNYIVTYDIANPKRLRKVFKACKDYGMHLQLSVFECDLTPAEKIDFESRLRGLIDREQEQILFIALGPSETRRERVITTVGTKYVKIGSPNFGGARTRVRRV